LQKVRNLEVWRLAMEFADAVYRLSEQFPPDERFGATQQLRRAVLSIAANIAEGAARNSDGDFRRFVRIAIGSLEESATYLEFARRRAWIARAAADGIGSKLETLRAKLLRLEERLRSGGLKPEA